MMKHLYIINNESRAMSYGIGTYTRQLVKALNSLFSKITIITLSTDINLGIHVEEKESIRYISFPTYRSENTNPDKALERYQRNIYYSLESYFLEKESNYFHFNFPVLKELARQIHQNGKGKIVLAVHYMDWSFKLNGDVEKLVRITTSSVSSNDIAIQRVFESEKVFMNEYADHIIAIASHSRDTICHIYGVQSSRICLIPNGMEDQYLRLTDKGKDEIRRSFHISPDEKIIVFAGRLEWVKGVSHLIEAFKNVLEENPDTRLMICGDGWINEFIKDIYPYASRISFTGFIPQNQLFHLYAIADIGVVPSLHEEFGYVAVEMMMMGLPIIVNQTTGLKEIVKDEVNGNYIDIPAGEVSPINTSRPFADKILHLLNDNELQLRYKEEGRKKFKAKYDLRIFQEKIRNFYQQI